MMKIMLTAHAEGGGKATTANPNQMGTGSTKLTPKQLKSFENAQKRGKGGAWLSKFGRSRQG